MDTNSDYWNIFLSKYGDQFEKVKQLLDFLKSSPHFIKAFEITEINDSLSIEDSQKEWLWLLSKQEHPLEQNFFKPYWIPLSKNEYGYYLDISTEKIQLIDHNYFFYKPYQWYKKVIYDDIGELILDIDKPNKMEYVLQLNRDKDVEIFRQIINEHIDMGLKGLIKVESVEYDELFDPDEGFEKNLYQWDGEKLIINNVGALVCGLLPYKTKIKVTELEFKVGEQYEDIHKIKTIKDFVFILRVSGIFRVSYFKINITGNSIIEYSHPDFTFKSKKLDIVDDFCRAFDMIESNDVPF